MSTTGQTLHIAVTCYICGGDVEEVTRGSRRHWQLALVVRCTECDWRGVVNTELCTTVDRPDLVRRQRQGREWNSAIRRTRKFAKEQALSDYRLPGSEELVSA